MMVVEEEKTRRKQLLGNEICRSKLRFQLKCHIGHTPFPDLVTLFRSFLALFGSI